MYTRQLRKLSATRLDDVLIDEGVLARSHVEDAQAESEMTGRPLAHVLFEREEMDEWELAKVVARSYSLPFVDVTTYSVPREAEGLLDVDFCRTHLLMPFDAFGGIPAVAVCEMPTAAVLDEIEQRCGHLPFVYVTLRSRLLEALDARTGAAPAVAPGSTVMSAVRPRSPARTGEGIEGLESASMRLGFNMHMRPPSASAKPLQPRPKAPVVSRPEPPVAPAPASAGPAGGDAEPAAAKAGQGAAWQSIFDLGDEATLES